MARGRREEAGAAQQMVTVYMTKPTRLGEPLRPNMTRETDELNMPTLDSDANALGGMGDGSIDATRNGRKWCVTIPKQHLATAPDGTVTAHALPESEMVCEFIVGQPKAVAEIPEEVMDEIRKLARQKQIVTVYSEAPAAAKPEPVITEEENA